MTYPIVVLFSGRGSNFESLINAQPASSYQIVGCISNRRNAAGIELARRHRIPCEVIEHKSYPDRNSFDSELARTIDRWQPRLIILAGFMRILGEPLVNRYLGSMINIHPSILPKYPGLHTHQRALDTGDREHGASVHIVTPDLDAGPVVSQVRIPIMAEDDPDSLADRLLIQEHRLYPQTVELFATEQLQWKSGQVFYNGLALNEPIQISPK